MYNLYLKTIREGRLEKFAYVLGQVTTSNVTERKRYKKIEILICVLAPWEKVSVSSEPVRKIILEKKERCFRAIPRADG